LLLIHFSKFSQISGSRDGNTFDNNIKICNERNSDDDKNIVLILLNLKKVFIQRMISDCERTYSLFEKDCFVLLDEGNESR
jgi:hypothetical protein